VKARLKALLVVAPAALAIGGCGEPAAAGAKDANGVLMPAGKTHEAATDLGKGARPPQNGSKGSASESGQPTSGG